MTTGDEPIEFNGTLAELRDTLTNIAREHPGKWARRRKHNGTLIAVRISQAKHEWQLVIGHEVAPSTFMGKARREAEVVEIVRGLGASGWTRRDDHFEGESVAACYAIRLGDPMPFVGGAR